jgi:hypothetical protein
MIVRSYNRAEDGGRSRLCANFALVNLYLRRKRLAVARV